MLPISSSYDVSDDIDSTDTPHSLFWIAQDIWMNSVFIVLLYRFGPIFSKWAWVNLTHLQCIAMVMLSWEYIAAALSSNVRRWYMHVTHVQTAGLNSVNTIRTEGQGTYAADQHAALGELWYGIPYLVNSDMVYPILKQTESACFWIRSSCMRSPCICN